MLRNDGALIAETFVQVDAHFVNMKILIQLFVQRRLLCLQFSLCKLLIERLGIQPLKLSPFHKDKKIQRCLQVKVRKSLLEVFIIESIIGKKES